MPLNDKEKKTYIILIEILLHQPKRKMRQNYTFIGNDYTIKLNNIPKKTRTCRKYD
jgi:hypothetical protein